MNLMPIGIKVKIYLIVNMSLVIATIIATFVLCIALPNYTDWLSGMLNISAGLICIAFILMIVNGWITGKTFDPEFKNILTKDTIANEYFSNSFSGTYFFSSKMIRAAFYSAHVVFRYRSKRNVLSRYLFHGYDFRGNARRIDIIISIFMVYVFFIGTGIFFVSIVLRYILAHYFGIHY